MKRIFVAKGGHQTVREGKDKAGWIAVPAEQGLVAKEKAQDVA